MKEKESASEMNGSKEKGPAILNDEPDSEDTVLMRNVGNSPVILVGEASDAIAQVVVSAPKWLDTLGGRKTRIWKKFGPCALFLL